MRLYVQIQDDEGEILAEHEADACQPSVWNAPSDRKFVGGMPQNSDNKNTGTYQLFRITFQPVVRVDRPNGYQEVPRPPEPAQWGKNPPTPIPNLGLNFKRG